MRIVFVLIILLVSLVAMPFINELTLHQPQSVMWRCCDMDEHGTIFIASPAYLLIYKHGELTSSLPTTGFPEYMFYENNNRLYLITADGGFSFDTENYPSKILKDTVIPYQSASTDTYKKRVDLEDRLRKQQYDKKKKPYGEVQLHSFIGYKWVEYTYQEEKGVISMPTNNYILEIMTWVSIFLILSSIIYLVIHYREFASFLDQFRIE